jgi:hypothetical protein
MTDVDKWKKKQELRKEFYSLTEALMDDDLSDVRHHATKLATMAQVMQYEIEQERYEQERNCTTEKI